MTKIMIVDDETDLRNMVDLMLSKEGFETKTAEDGADFLNKIDNFNPDLVTLDVMMPGLTTKEILKKLKDKKSNPKIILLTVLRYTESERDNIMKLGNIVEYIAKPFDIDDLTTCINKHLAKQIAIK